MSNLYYIQDARQYVGNCVLWWGKAGSGYTTHLDEAGLYDEEYLKTLRPSDVPWPEDIIKAAASLQVDMQRLDSPEAKSIREEAWKRQQEANKPAPRTVTNCNKCGQMFYSQNPYQEECKRCDPGGYDFFDDRSAYGPNY